MSQYEQYHISIPCASRVQPHAQLPPPDLLNGTSEDYNEICLPLYKASITGNTMAAKVILGKRPELVRFSITERYETALHIAALGESLALVEYLVSIMSKDGLEIPNINGETALYKAAITGNIEIARILVRENNNLLDIPDYDGKTPIYMAALCGKRGMANFLYKESQQMTGEFWTNENRGLVFVKCVEANLFDVALQMVNKHPVLATNGSVLRLLAQKPHEFYVMRPGIISGLVISIFRVCNWKIWFPENKSDCDALQLLRFILIEIGKLPKDELVAILRGPPDETKEDEKKTPYQKDTQEAMQLLRTISENIAKMPAQIFSLFKDPVKEKTTALNDGKCKYSSRVLFLASEMGNTAFIAEVIRQYPHLVWEVNDDNQSIFHVAVSYGHVGVYKLLKELGSSSKDLILALEDKDGNNMLHLVGEKAKGDRVNNIRGVGMQLNPEIFWFKEIENITPPRLRQKKNAAGLTPQKVFIKNHKDLFSKGEDWMKEIATQLMVVAALVATASYTLAFDLPGGYDDQTAEPTFTFLFLFRVFIIFDTLSFIASTTSILMVLSILGSNYDEYDFMISLSKQLGICIASVFVSIATMITTFVIYRYQSQWTLPTLISISAVTPFVIFAFSKYHLQSRIMRGFKMLYEPRKFRLN